MLELKTIINEWRRISIGTKCGRLNANPAVRRAELMVRIAA